MSQDNTDHDPFKYWQQKELKVPYKPARPPSPRPSRSTVKPSPSRQPVSKRPSLSPPPRPPDPSELFRPVRISSTGGSRESTLKVASLTRKFEMTSSTSPTPPSPSPSRRTLPRPLTPTNKPHEDDPRDAAVPWSAPPTLRPPPKRTTSWNRLNSSGSIPKQSSFISHLDGPPLDPAAVSAELREVSGCEISLVCRHVAFPFTHSGTSSQERSF